MNIRLAAVVLLLGTTPAIADPAKPAAAAAAPASAASAQAFSRNTPFEVLVSNPATKAATLNIFPDIDKHPAWDMFKGMSPQQVTDATGAIPEEKLAALDTALKDVK